MGQGISRREFARRDGCSESLVRQGITKGKLAAFGDGTIDPALIGTPWRQSANGSAPGAQTAQGVRRPVEVPRVEAPPEPATEDGEVISFAEAQRRKEVNLARLRELEFETKSGRLVERDVIGQQLAELWQTERDAWLNLPARIAPLIAARFGIDSETLIIVLEQHVREHLAERVERPVLRALRPDA